MSNFFTKEEFFEINLIVKNAEHFYINGRLSYKTRNDWYAGVTGQGKDKEFGLERIRAHLNGKFPNLDTESVFFWKVSSAEVAVQIERELKKLDFDTGEAHQPPKEEGNVYVYIFRKNE